MRRKLPSLTEDVEKMVQATIDVAGAEAMKNSEANKEATDKANEEAQKVADKFAKEEDKMVDKAEKESLKESIYYEPTLFDDTFSDLYKDLIFVSGVEDNIHTHFGKDDKFVDIIIDVNDSVDVSGIYDVTDIYKLLRNVKVDDSDEDKIKIHYDFTKEDRKREKPDEYDLFTEIYNQLTMGGGKTRFVGNKVGDDRGVGYDPAQVGADRNDNAIRVVLDDDLTDDRFLKDLAPAREIAEKYADIGVTFVEKDELVRLNPKKYVKVLTIKIPEGAKAAYRDYRLEKTAKKNNKKSAVKESKSVKESIPNGPGTDVFYDLIDRAKSWIDVGEDVDEAVNHAIDDGLIYSDDIIALARSYGVIDDGELISAMYEYLYDDLYGEVSDYDSEEEKEDEE